MVAEDAVIGALRAALDAAGGRTEMKMFGGTGFMLNGNMVAALSQRGLLLRVGPEAQAEALAVAGARAMEMRGKPMLGYVYFDPAAIAPRTLRTWIDRAVGFVSAMPAKAKGKTKAKAPRSAAKKRAGK